MTLRHTLLLTSPLWIAAAGLLALALAPTGATGPSGAAPAPVVGPGVTWTKVERFVRAIDEGRPEEALELLSPDLNMDREYQQRPCTLVLSGVDGLDRVAVGHEAASKLVAEWATARGEHGKRAPTRAVDAWDDCPSQEVLWGSVVIERTGADGSPEQLFVTALMHYSSEGPRLTHLHVSPRGEESRSVELLHWAPDLKERGEGKGGSKR